jgi:2-oxoglutarate ferredoxin oxidoreductase subunit delta
MAKITLLTDPCKGVEDCGICIFVCPKKVLIESGEMNEAGYLPPTVTDETLCTGCENCMVSCPDFAIVVEKGSRKTSDTGGGRDG